MKNEDIIKTVFQLFSCYNLMKQEIEMQKIGLKHLTLLNIDDEIESLSLNHPVGSNDCGKSSVFNVSKKPETIALSIAGNLKKEAAEYANRISLLENVTSQISAFVNSLSDEDKTIFNLKFFDGQLSKAISSSMSISTKTISRKCKLFALNFYKVTSLTPKQISESVKKYVS